MVRTPGGYSPVSLLLSQVVFFWIFSGLLSFSSSAIAITVTTNAPTEIGQTAAGLVGSINQVSGNISVIFLYGTNAQNLSQSTPPSNYVYGPEGGRASYFVSGLTCQTTYYYRLKVSTASETIQSDVISFVTDPCVSVTAEVATLEAKNITRSSARMLGSIATASAYARLEYYFEYGFGATFGNVTNKTILNSQSSVQKNVSVDLFNLSCGTVYQYRLVAVLTAADATEETVLGNTITFSTQDCAGIEIMSLSQLSTGRTTATIGATISSPINPIEVFFAYGDTDAVSLSTSVKSFGPGISTVSEYLVDLNCDSTYYYALVIKDTTNEIRSDIKNVKTASCSAPPSLQTLQPLSVTQISATLYAVVTANDAATQVYFDWGSSESLGTQTEAQTIVGGVGGKYVEAEINNLLCNTQYFAKAVAENENGFAQGQVLSFLTLPCNTPSEDPVAQQRLYHVSAGTGHSVAVVKSGEVITWGANDRGQLGNKTRQINLIDGVQDSSGTSALLFDFADAAAGSAHTLLLNDQGDVFAFGDNARGQLGVETGSKKTIYTIYKLAFGFSTDKVVDIDAGESHSIALTAQGLVYTWGDNRLGQMGTPNLVRSPTPQLVEELSDIKSVSAGNNFNIVVKSDGSLQGWGDNQFGQLANEDLQTQFTILDIANVTDIVMVAAGESHVLALKASGDVLSWGRNQSAQLGRSDAEFDSVPGNVSAVDGFTSLKSVAQVAAGAAHSLALLQDGSVVAWGDNSSGQLGVASEEVSVQLPLPVVDAQNSPLTNIQFIAAGDNFSVAVNQNGEIFSWGDNSKNQLRGSSTDAGFGQLKDLFGNNISLTKPRIIIDTYPVAVKGGDTSHIRVRLSAAPEVATEITSRLEGQTPLSIQRGQQLFFGVSDWFIPQTLTIDAQDAKSAIATSLVLSAEGFDTLTIPVEAEIVKPKLKEQTIGSVSVIEVVLLITVFVFMYGEFKKINLSTTRN